VDAKARLNQQFLHDILETDEGSKKLGEFGIGTNFGIERFVKTILFDEKIGGTVHLALGSSAFKTASKGLNESGIHMDMLVDLRKTGEIYTDGKLFQKNGKFVNSFE
jgi:aminopeptidase